MADIAENPVALGGANRAGAHILKGNEYQPSAGHDACNAQWSSRYRPPEIALWKEEFNTLATDALLLEKISRSLKTDDFRRTHGINEGLLLNLGMTHNVLKVCFLNGRFNFAYSDDGEDAFVFEVIEEHRVPPDDLTELVTVDFVAFSLANPTKFATAMGKGVALGLANVENLASCYKNPLRVWKTPLRWLQKECQGCVILEPRSSPNWLGECPGEISGETLEHSQAIGRMLHGLFDKRRIVAPLKAV